MVEYSSICAFVREMCFCLSWLRVIFIGTAICFVTGVGGYAQTTIIQPEAEMGATLRLDAIKIVAKEGDYDATGMGSMEEELKDPTFTNSLISVSDYTVDGDGSEMSSELSAVTETSPADRIAGEDRLKLRGFPTPTMRNGFIQVGFPETLNTAQTIVIQGPLVPVLGRAAPGGIQNFMTARPRTKEQVRLNASVSSLDRLRASFEYNSPIVQKKSWQRLAIDWQRRNGPEEFAREELLAASAALTWRYSRSASTLLSLDFRQVSGLASPGIPEYRVDAAHRIAGRYLPLAEFNANGPDAGVLRRSATVGLQFDGQPAKNFALRAGVEAWWRNLEQDRFTNPVYNLATGLFEGIREPRHLEQPQAAVALQLEGTLRIRSLGAEHKLLASANNTWGSYTREERSLPVALRNALPLSVRQFDPYAPDYYRPDYSEELYSRINTDRHEQARYSSFEASDRLSWMRGRLVMTAGLRYDEVGIVVEDDKPGAKIPLTEDNTQQLSYHGGLNYQVIQNRLLAFATTSTAFDPSTPVDARTGRIQDNETTLGYEAGFRTRVLKGRLEMAGVGFILFNQNIARRNPLYNDPIADANQGQPQLVASGEEQFTGGRAELKWTVTGTLNLTMKGNYTRAVTTASPDLPQEVGRPITRLPAYNVSANLRHRPAGVADGFTWGASWMYLDGYVANHEDSRRDFLLYPGYGIVGLNAGYRWRWDNRQVEFETGVRNAFDRDLLASNDRVGAGREYTLSARMTF